MSSIAVAQGFAPQRTGTQPTSRHRKQRGLYLPLPWNEVPLATPASQVVVTRKRYAPASWLIILAIAAHVAVVWYAITHATTTPKAQRTEVAVELITPPKPQPKIEPPKPQPSKPQVVKQAQVLPPIEQSPPEPSNASATSSEPPVAVAPIVSAPPAPAPEPVTAAFGRAGYLNNPAPEYPAIASRQGWQGTVILRVHVLSTGKPDVVEVQKSSGHKQLDDEAARTVKNSWSYTPAKRGTTAIDGWTTTPIEFRLDG